MSRTLLTAGVLLVVLAAAEPDVSAVPLLRYEGEPSGVVGADGGSFRSPAGDVTRPAPRSSSSSVPDGGGGGEPHGRCTT